MCDGWFRWQCLTQFEKIGKHWCMLLRNLQTRNLMKPAVVNFSFLFTSFTFVVGGTCAFCQPLPWWITLERRGQGLINCVKIVGQSDFSNGIISGVQPVWVTKTKKMKIHSICVCPYA